MLLYMYYYNMIQVNGGLNKSLESEIEQKDEAKEELNKLESKYGELEDRLTASQQQSETDKQAAKEAITKVCNTLTTLCFMFIPYTAWGWDWEPQGTAKTV